MLSSTGRARVEDAAASPRVQDLAESLQDGPPPARYVQREPIPGLPSSISTPGVIPVVDMSAVASDPDGDEAARLASALGSWGMFHAVGHGIPASLLNAVHDVAREFFRLPREEKARFYFQEREGYGNEQLVSEEQVLDWNDRLYLLVQPVELRKLDLWPNSPAEFSKVLSEYSAKTKAMADDLLRAVARTLPGLADGSFLEQLGTNPRTFVRFNYYPRCGRPELVYGIKPHSDASVLTLLLLDADVEGLQVLRNDKWVSVPAVPGAVLVNIGDQLEIMSNGAYHSPIHRVVISAIKERLSVALFYWADFEQMIGPAEALVGEGRPPLYRKVNAREYLDVLYQRFSGGSRPIDWVKAREGINDPQ